MGERVNRRTFLGTSVAAGLPSVAATAETGNQYIELSFYSLSGGTNQRGRLAAFLENEHLPMTKRLGMGPVGYFGLREVSESVRSRVQRRGETLPEPDTRIVTLTAYDSWSAVEEKRAAQRADKKWTEAIDALNDEAPAYDRIESWLLRTFDGLPRIEVPPIDIKRTTRIFDLRIAENPNLSAAVRKIEQFNTVEIQIFRKCGLNPVLFGEALFGSRMPNLWFMVWYNGPQARAAAWEAFRENPEWARTREDPRYKGTTSGITDTFLQPLLFSPIR